MKVIFSYSKPFEPILLYFDGERALVRCEEKTLIAYEDSLTYVDFPAIDGDRLKEYIVLTDGKRIMLANEKISTREISNEGVYLTYSGSMELHIKKDGKRRSKAYIKTVRNEKIEAENHVEAIEFIEDTLVIGGEFKYLSFLSLSDLREYKRIPVDAYVYSIKHSDALYVAGGDVSRGIIEVFRGFERIKKAYTHKSRISTIEVSNRLYTADATGRLIAREDMRVYKETKLGKINALIVADKLYVAGDALYVLDPESLEEIYRKEAHEEEITSLALHGKVLYTGSKDGKLGIRSIRKEPFVKYLEHGAPIYSLALYEDLLAVGSLGKISIYDVSKPFKPTLLFELFSSDRRIAKMKFSPDGRILATATRKLLDLRYLGEKPKVEARGNYLKVGSKEYRSPIPILERKREKYLLELEESRSEEKPKKRLEDAQKLANRFLERPVKTLLEASERGILKELVFYISNFLEKVDRDTYVSKIEPESVEGLKKLRFLRFNTTDLNGSFLNEVLRKSHEVYASFISPSINTRTSA